MQPNAHSLNLCITTHCNMRCPNCFMRLPTRQGLRHQAMDEIREVARCFRGIEQVKFTGGEPSIHPEFEKIAATARELFQCRILACDTNGMRFKQIPEVFARFDYLYVSHYGEWNYPGCPDNSGDIAFLQAFYRHKQTPWIRVESGLVHKPITGRGTRPCSRLTNGLVAVSEGRIYPCCGGPGVLPDVSIPLCTDWREKIVGVMPPCHQCLFAEP